MSYVGRFDRNLLTQRDLRQPPDLVDAKTGIDYFAAATRLAQLAQKGLTSSQITDALVGPTAAFWHDMLPPLRPGATAYQDLFTRFTGSLLQAIYDLCYNPKVSYVGNEVVGLGDIDIYYGLGDNLSNTYSYFFNQPERDARAGQGMS
jgi:hypothetical protein